MIKTIKPYGYIKKEFIKSYWQYKNQFFIRDISGNEYQIERHEWEVLNKDD